MPRKPRTQSKTDWAPRFLEALADTHGQVLEACRRAEIGRRTAYDRRQKDESFADLWDTIVDSTTEQMEAEARRRAVDGWRERELFNDDGEPIGEVRKYSDTLLIFLLKARRPHIYRERQSIELTGAGGGPVETRALLGGADPATVDPDKRRQIAEILTGDSE